MKFGKRLLEDLMEPGWEPYYVEYYALKKLIVQVVELHGLGQEEEEVVLVNVFLNRLNGNVCCSEEFARSTLATLDNSKLDIEKKVTKLKHISIERHEDAEATLDEFVEWSDTAQALLRFCVTNRTAVYKILKKLEKNTRFKLTNKIGESKKLFSRTEEQLNVLVGFAKELELKLMVSCTEYMVRIRTRRGHHSMEVERQKLRRMESFERDLIRLFVQPKVLLPDIYMTFHPLFLLGSCFVCFALFALSLNLVGWPAGVVSLLPEALVGEIASPLIIGSTFSLIICIYLEHQIVLTKLRCTHRNGRTIHLLSFLTGLGYAIFALKGFLDAVSVEGICSSVLKDSTKLSSLLDRPVTVLAGWLYLLIESFLQVHHDLCSRQIKAFRLCWLALYTAMCIPLLIETTYLEEALSFKSLGYDWRLPTVGLVHFHTLFLCNCLTFLPEFRLLLVEAQIRARFSRAWSSRSK